MTLPEMLQRFVYVKNDKEVTDLNNLKRRFTVPAFKSLYGQVASEWLADPKKWEIER